MTDINAIYFVGAGGIGMSALERYFRAEGLRVGGYDRTPSKLTETLAAEGISIHYEDNIDAVDAAFKDPQHTLVVYTPAIPATHGELNYFRTHGFRVLKRAQLLGLITEHKRGLCVAGTHGKTTTSSMIAHMLKQSHTTDCAAFLGGILKPYGTNLMLSDSSDLTVIEADEFDRSFHTLSPYMAVITSCDPDHLDIYGTEEAYRESFAHFTSLIRPGGVLLMHRDIKVQPRLQPDVRQLSYAVEAPADFEAVNVRIGGGTILFDLKVAPGCCAQYPEGALLRDMEPGVPAPINVDNATAALAICLLNGCEEDELREALKSFGGACRRFDFYIKSDHLVLMDDYAHHPDEIKASLRSVRQLYPGRRLTVVFQPHLYTRTRDLAEGFAEALSLPDHTLLLPIYPARELPIEGVNSEMLLARMTTPEREVCPRQQLIERLLALQAEGRLDLLVMMGAGDIERLVLPVRDALLAAQEQ
jgi:UDP-N-acetylmuramate--alanine ligase